MDKALVWFRQDLRIMDNPALLVASECQKPLIFLYILDDTKHPWAMGGASKVWLHHSLKVFAETLKEKYQAQLVLRRGNPEKIIKEICQEEQVSEIYLNRCYEPYQLELDQKIEKNISAEILSFNSALLHDPWEYHTQSGQPFKVFTPFWKTCQKLEVRELLDAPKNIQVHKKISSLKLSELDLLPQINWYSQIEKTWDVGEESALKKLKNFVPKLASYQELRNRPDYENTSRLSPHLHFGEIGPVQIWHELESKKASETYLSEIAWREFSYHLLYYFKKLPDVEFKEKYAKFPWTGGFSFLEKWQKGQTGCPIVDAGMLELWHTGWMHNRVRMIVASFLIKNLGVSWRKGEAWFWDTLVDADLANNSASWQWVFGSGADAAPYFRIFNPVLQGQKFDPDGEYVKKWLPQLKNLPEKYIHCPWEAPKEVLLKAKVTLGENYPKLLVDLGQSRTEALARFKAL